MAEHLIDELKSVGCLLDAQVKAGMNEDDVKESICRSWVNRIHQQHHLRDHHKAALTAAIGEGPWEPEQRKLLASTLLASRE